MSGSGPGGTEPAPGRLLLWCLVWLILCRAAIALWNPAWQGRDDIADAAAFLREARTRDLRVVALGSSRMHSAFDARTWARLAGLRPDQVVDLSLDNGQFWDARTLLERTGGIPESVELVLIEAARWNFNRNKVSPVWGRRRYDYPQHFRQQGGLLDRWSVDDPGDRIALLFELVWPLYQRRPLADWIEVVRAPREAVPQLSTSVHWFEAQHAKLRAVRALRADSIVFDHFDDPAMSSFATRNFDRLVRAAGERGARIVLVTLPTRSVYQDLIGSDPIRARFVAAVDESIASQQGPGVRWVACFRPEDCGLDEGIFVDYGHMTLDGARAFTAALFERVETDRNSN